MFAVIGEALTALAEADPKAGKYAARRRAEIAREVPVMGDARSSLTPAGTSLWDKLLARVGRPE